MNVKYGMLVSQNNHEFKEKLKHKDEIIQILKEQIQRNDMHRELDLLQLRSKADSL